MKRTNKKWTKEEVLQDAQRYQEKREWSKKSPKAYSYAVRNGIIDECCKHMKILKKIWTKEEILEDALKYSTRFQWKLNSSAYDIARRNGWLEESCKHMKKLKNSWTEPELFAESKKFKTRNEWCLKSNSSYEFAKRRGWLDRFCQHMPVISRSSKVELNILSVVKKFYPKAQSAWFKVKDPKFAPAKRFQLDIYVPELRKGIEFNGDYWHSFEGLKKGRPSWTDEQIENYHELKRNFFFEKHIDIFDVWEKDWKEDKEREIRKILDFLDLPTNMSDLKTL